MELTDILRNYQLRFDAKYAGRISPQQASAMKAVLACRTDRYGSMHLECTSCHSQSAMFHSCGNRSCHRCQHHETTRWLERQSQKLLPVEYFMVTFTLPFELRSLAWDQQKRFYNYLLECAKSTLMTFSKNDSRLGGSIGLTAVLHTHSRRLDFHPHVHCVVPAVCIDSKRRQCTTVREHYLFNELNLATVFRARFLQAMRDDGIDVPDGVPQQWVADCRHVGKGMPALQYLSRYLYRGVISDANILRDDGEQVTFRYVESKTNIPKTRTLKGEDFLWLVYQHVLPKGFRRVRDYGFLNGNARRTLQRIQIALRLIVEALVLKPRPVFRCQTCGSPLTITAFTRPAWQDG